MYIKILEQNLYFQKVGKGKNLILLHGWGQDSSAFWGLIEDLRNDYTVWLIDLPGFGRSDPPKKTFGVSDYVQLIAEFIKKNRIKKPSLLGHSVGGRVSIKLASSHPELLDKLVLEASAGIKPEESRRLVLLYPLAKAFHYLMPKSKLKSIIRYRFYSNFQSDYLESGVLKDTFKKIVSEDLTADVSKIKTPTLILWGDKDLIVPLKYGKKIYRLINNSKIEILEGLHHEPHLENPQLFLHYVRDFI